MCTNAKSWNENVNRGCWRTVAFSTFRSSVRIWMWQTLSKNEGVREYLCIRENGDYWTSKCSCCLEISCSTIVGWGVCQCCAGKAPESVWQSAGLLKGEMQESQLGGRTRSSLGKWKNWFLVNDTNVPLPYCSTKPILPAWNGMKNNNNKGWALTGPMGTLLLRPAKPCPHHRWVFGVRIKSWWTHAE